MLNLILLAKELKLYGMVPILTEAAENPLNTRLSQEALL
jgi:hypothetical protein